MGDPSETVETMEEKVGEQRWIQQKGETVGDIEDVFEDSEQEEYSTARPPKRKAKKKDEGPLEIFCGMIVEHQIGMSHTIMPIGNTY
jgi:acyl-CoA-dependent ceramide synthase